MGEVSTFNDCLWPQPSAKLSAARPFIVIFTVTHVLKTCVGQ